MDRGGNSEGEFELCVSDAGYSQSCKIDLIEVVGQSSCDPSTNTYSLDLLVQYRHDGSATSLYLFNQSFPITSSPQMISIPVPASSGIFDLSASIETNSCYDYYYQRDAFQALAPCSNVPVNDECVNAVELMVTKGCEESIFDNTGATFSSEINFTCFAGNQSQDIWFQVEVPQSGELIINSWQTGQVRGAFEIYEGGCNNLTLIENCGIAYESKRLTGRPPGEVLYIVAYSSDVFLQGEFGLCAIEPEAHSNETCMDAVDVVVNSSCAQQVYSTHFANAETGDINCNGSSFEANDIWFNVIVPNSGDVSLYTDNIERNNFNMMMEVYAGNCQSPFSTCAIANGVNNNAEIILTGISAGTQLRIRISGLYGQPTTFLFCATSACPNHDVIGVISQGTRDFEADISILGYETLSSGTDVTFDAGMMVNLDPGFEVESGAVFHAFIDGCGGQ